MWLEAILTQPDLLHALNQFAPVTVRLGEGGGSLYLDTPTEVELVPDQGLRVVCQAKVHWPVLGIDVPVTLRSVDVLVTPVVERIEGADRLVFKLRVDHADFVYVPSSIDEGFTDLLNAELEKHHVELAWNFTETLANVFDLPPIFEPSESVSLGALGGMVKTTKEAMSLAVAMRADLLRGKPKSVAPVDAEPIAEPITKAVAEPVSARPARSRFPFIALAIGAALGAGVLIGRAARG